LAELPPATVEAVADTIAAAYPEAGRFEASQVAWRALHAALDTGELIRVSDLSELHGSALAGEARALVLEMFGESEVQRMRLRLGSVFGELVALRHAATALADALDRAAWLNQGTCEMPPAACATRSDERSGRVRPGGVRATTGGQ
jgi:hypothetical protein